MARQLIGAVASAAAVGETVGPDAGSSDDGLEVAAALVDVSDDEGNDEVADPGATAVLVEVGWLAQAAVTASAISAPPKPAARARALDPDLRAESIAADATPRRVPSQP